MQKIKKICYEEKQYHLSDLSETEVKLLRRTIEIAREAMESGNHPFGALLADADGNILMEQGNAEVTSPNCTGHAETTLMRRASETYSYSEMEKLILYSCCEPCCMCAGAMYWGHLGKMVYACTEAALKEVTGNDPRNPTLDLPCRAVFACGQRNVKVVGPIPELFEEFLSLHRGYWDQATNK